MSMKFRAHDTFFIRKGWLSKGMKYVNSNPAVFVDKENSPMDILGIGTNMVKALRYWLQAVGLTEEPRHGRRLQSFTEFGQCVFDNDRYIEEIGTLYLLHYKLACNKADATAWYYFFNEFNVSEFSKEDYVLALQNYVLINGESVASRSLHDDFNCIISTYLPRYKTNPNRVSAENNIDCPLGELGLVDVVNKQKKTYHKAMPPASSLNPWIVLAVIMDQAHGRFEISLNELLTAPCNIGKIFNLDAIVMLDALHTIEKLDALKIVRTAGLDIIQIKCNLSFQECVANYYAHFSDED